MKLLKSIVITLCIALSHIVTAQICLDVTDWLYGNIGSPPVQTFKESRPGTIRISKIKAWWWKYPGSVTNGALKAIQVTSVYEDDASESTWQAVIHETRNGYQEADIPEDRTIVAWEQSVHSHRGLYYATGFKVHLDDGSAITFGRFMASYGKQWIRGPIRGVQYYVGNSIGGSP